MVNKITLIKKAGASKGAQVVLESLDTQINKLNTLKTCVSEQHIASQCIKVEFKSWSTLKLSNIVPENFGCRGLPL